MRKTKQFLIENKKEIHALLNHMWRTIERIHVRMEEVLPDIDLENSHGNYIKIDDGWSEANYANPSIIFPFGELGYSLDSLFCVFSLNPKEFRDELLVKITEIINNATDVSLEIYGGDDCFQTFYSSQEDSDFDDTMKAIAESKEEIIQLEFSIEPFSEEETREAFLEAVIKLYELFNEKKILVKLPNYNFDS